MKNDWTRMAALIGTICNKLITGTYNPLPEAKYHTIDSKTWTNTIIDLTRAQNQCMAYGNIVVKKSVSNEIDVQKIWENQFKEDNDNLLP